jgi:TolB-like protein/class 3 adenylate cyclase
MGAVPVAREQRKLAAILAADVVGYSRLMGRDESGTLARLRKNRSEHLDPTLTKYGGRLVKLTGDGALIEFASAVDALSAAIEFQQAIAEANTDQPADTALVFRMGLHLGDLIVDGDDLYGDGVNIAARLEAEAPPGGVIVSGALHEAAAGKLQAEFVDLGRLSLKNIDRPVQAYRVEWNRGQQPTSAAASDANAPLPLPDKPSIAVLPFQNMSGDPEQEYFTDGMVEDIITALSRFKTLFVIARNSSFTYKGKAVDVRQVGRDLGVRYVLEGSVRKAANRLRISGQLIDAATGGHLWADHFDGVLEDVFELQDRVTSSVVGAIAPKLEQAETERAMRKPTENLDAYDCFLRAMAHYHLFTRDSMLEARRLFRRATDLDPAYASAYGYAAWCVTQSQANGWLAEPKHDIAEGVRLARRAAAIGKDDPTALSSSALCLSYLAHEVETGISLIDRAILLNPNLAMAWSVSGWLRAYVGEHADAIERFERAIRLSPFDLLANHFYTGMGFAHLFAGRYDEAASWARRAALENPDWASTVRVETIACALSGRIVEAREALARLRAIDPELRLSNLERVAPPLRRAEDRALFIEGLRRAGLPE